MKTLALVTASALALSVSACGPKTPPMRAALECPPTEGELTRTSASPDGQICTYASGGDTEITLQLVSTAGGGAEAALKTIESHLLEGRVAPAKVAADDEPKTGEKALSSGEKDIHDAVAEAVRDSSEAGVNVSINEHSKGIVIGDDDRGTTHVNLPGIHIVANEKDETANVRIGPLSINAGNDGATVRMSRSVRLRGEALSRQKRGLRATFIYTGKDLPGGYRYVGYEAAGPKAGPLSVAIVKSKSEGPDGSELYPDVQKLVRRNGGA